MNLIKVFIRTGHSRVVDLFAGRMAAVGIGNLCLQ
jgi:hypothetical protein